MRMNKSLLVLGLSLGLSTSVYAVDDAFWLDVSNNKLGAVTRYLAQGTDPNITSREQQPAVMWAIQNKAWAVYDLLRAHKQFDPNSVNGHDETPLMYLALMGEQERAQELIAQGAKVNRLGWTPLHYAASRKQMGMAKFLLAQGALVNAASGDGTTVLMMAARSGSSDMVNLLLEQGADPTVRSLSQLSAADWAESNKHTRLAKQLEEVSSRYGQQRIKQKGVVSPMTVDTPAVESRTIPLKESTTSSTNSQYFDLKRFDNPAEF